MVIVRDFEKHKYNLPVHGANAPSGSSIQAEGPDLRSTVRVSLIL